MLYHSKKHSLAPPTPQQMLDIEDDSTEAAVLFQAGKTVGNLCIFEPLDGCHGKLNSILIRKRRVQKSDIYWWPVPIIIRILSRTPNHMNFSCHFQCFYCSCKVFSFPKAMNLSGEFVAASYAAVALPLYVIYSWLK